MYIEQIKLLELSEHKATIMKSMNQRVFNGSEYCYFKPSHILDAAEYIQSTNIEHLESALSKYSPFECKLIFSAIDAKNESELQLVTDRVRNANRQGARYIATELNKLKEVINA